MPPNTFRKMIANAYFNHWLTIPQIIALWQQTNLLEASKQALKRVIERIKERKGYLETEEISLDSAELSREIEVQLQRLESAGVKRLEQRQRSNARLRLSADLQEWLLGENEVNTRA